MGLLNHRPLIPHGMEPFAHNRCFCCPAAAAAVHQVDPKRAARAEKAKVRGNDAYKAGRYMEAIKAYSEAMKQNPTNPVYISNRAMAYLKVFR